MRQEKAEFSRQEEAWVILKTNELIQIEVDVKDLILEKETHDEIYILWGNWKKITKLMRFLYYFIHKNSIKIK